MHGLLDAAFEALGLIGDYAVAERQAAFAAGKEEHRDSLRCLEKMRCFSLTPTNRERLLLQSRSVSRSLQRGARREINERQT